MKSDPIPRRRLALVLLVTSLCAVAAVAGPTTFTSDDFNAFNLKRPLWTLVDPKGDVTMNLQGVNTSNARLYMTVPGGSQHDIWTTGKMAPHVLQDAVNEDFTMEVKFESSVTGTSYSSYQAQGILIQADANNLIRFDFTTGNTDSTKAFAAVFVGGFTNPQVKIDRGVSVYGIAPLYLRVNRAGDLWTMLVSLDGVNFQTMGSFTHAMAVSKMGLYAINAGGSPQAFTMIADYFMNVDNPISPEDGATGVTDTQGPLVYAVNFKTAPNAMLVTWKTDEPANSLLEYGPTTSYGTTLALNPYVTEHRMTIGSLTPSRLYHFKISGADQGGRSDNSGDLTATTTAYVQDTLSVSDDFNGATLDAGLWTFVNPLGDVSATVGGKQLTFAVPGGIKHEPWTSGNSAPRVVQNAAPTVNTNEWTLKFNSIPAGSANSIPMQGMYFEQDSVNFVRVDIFSDGTGAYLFAAGFTNGLTNPDVHTSQPIPITSAPVWLRVTRGGALWRIYYSADGTNWGSASSFFRVITLNKVGPFAGNAGSAPQAFTALIDYFQGALPGKPSLLQPANAQTNVIRPVAFIWDTTVGAASYRLQVSTASNFGTTVVDTVQALTSKEVSVLQPTTQYYWRVRGTNGTLNGSYSATQSFTTAIGAPAAPSLVSPADDVQGISITPTLTWTKPAATTKFLLQVGTDSTFASGLAVNDSTLIDAVATTTPLAYNTRYFWRAAAGNAGGFGPFSAVRRFTTRPETPPVPTLVSPANGATDQPVSLTFAWNASEGATGYSIQIDTDSLFAPPLTLDDSTVTGTSRAVSGLAHSTVYYWRIRARNAGGSSAPSETRSFTTVIAPPSQATLVSPANGATGQLSSIAFAWTRPATTIMFHLQVGTDSTFATGLVYNDSTLTDTTQVVGSLAYGMKYFWHVKAKNAGGSGPASEVFSFVTLPADPTIPVQVFPANGATVTEQNVTFSWTAPQGASSFRLQVATDSLFATGIVLDDPAVLATSRTVNGLAYTTKYFWRVNADNVGGISPWSPTFSFFVTVPLPGEVNLYSPVNNALMSTDSALVAWRASTAPLVDRYQVDLAADSLFTFKVSDSTVTDTVKMFRSLVNGQRYFWRVRAHNPAGWGSFVQVLSFTASNTVDVAEQRELPTTISLSQNYPNPFNPSTQIEFGLPRDGHVLLEVYNLLGERVATLVDEAMTVGYHTVRFDASQLSSGLYLYRLVSGNSTFVRKMMFVK